VTSARTSRILLGILGVVILLAAWQVIGATGIAGHALPPLTDVVATFVERFPLLMRATGATAARAAVGGAIGFVLGLVLAAVTAWWPRSGRTVVRSAVIVNAIPIVAIGPVLMSLEARPYIPEIFAALSVLFSTVVTASDGMRAAAASSRDVFQVFRASRTTRFLHLDLPSALPLLADALRLAIPAAVLGALLGEWFGAERGLGVVMVSSMRNIQYAQLWAAALIAVLISLLAYALATGLEKAASARFARTGSAPSEMAPLTRFAATVTGIAVPVALVLLWQLWIVIGEVPLIVAPPPLGVAIALGTDPGQYLAAAGLTLGLAAGGVAVGGLIGLLLAIAVSLAPWLSAMLSPLALVIPTVPIVVFIPIVGSFFGYGVSTVFVSCVLMAFFPIYVLALTGLQARPAGSDDLFTVYRTGRFRRLTRLALPAAVPSLLLALRLAAANAILIAISAEWLMGQGGLGRLLSEKRVMLDTAGSWAAVVVAVVMAVLVYAGAERLERVVGRRWRS
jgi:ABC-type nitrate/sulfonate/bicarbonate transport system permease component